jgi:hypothetical protein
MPQITSFPLMPDLQPRFPRPDKNFQTDFRFSLAAVRVCRNRRAFFSLLSPSCSDDLRLRRLRARQRLLKNNKTTKPRPAERYELLHCLNLQTFLYIKPFLALTNLFQLHLYLPLPFRPLLYPPQPCPPLSARWSRMAMIATPRTSLPRNSRTLRHRRLPSHPSHLFSPLPAFPPMLPSSAASPPIGSHSRSSDTS